MSPLRSLISLLQWQGRQIELSDPVEVRVAGIPNQLIIARYLDQGYASVGYGVALSEKLAALKAVMESVERATFLGDVPQASAAGLVFGGVRERAYGELVERDSLYRWSNGLSQSMQLSRVGEFQSIRIRSSDPEWYVVMSAHTGFECVPFGLGCARDLEAARRKSYEELAMSLYRHQVVECGSGSGRSAMLHSETRRDWFKGALSQHHEWDRPGLNSSALISVRNTRFSRSKLNRCWPVVVVHAENERAFWLDKWIISAGAGANSSRFAAG